MDDEEPDLSEAEREALLAEFKAKLGDAREAIRAAREENSTYLTELRAFDNELATNEAELKQRHGRAVEGAWDEMPPPPPALPCILHMRGGALRVAHAARGGTAFTSRILWRGETKFGK